MTIITAKVFICASKPLLMMIDITPLYLLLVFCGLSSAVRVLHSAFCILQSVLLVLIVATTTTDRQ